MFYEFRPREFPFAVSTTIRFLQKATILRRQFERGEKVSFSPETRIRMVVPTSTPEYPIEPYVIATCPFTGATLRLTVHLDESRGLNNRNDAIAYLRRVLCKEAIMVTERDLHNVAKYGERKHYTVDFFKDLIAKYRHRIETFHTYNYGPVYD